MHEHHHHHEHCHHHHTDNLKNLLIVLSITTFYMVAEFIGGYLTNSLALIADAGHMLSDVASLALSFAAIWLVSRKAPINKTYGYFRAEVISAFINGLTLVVISGLIFFEAYKRLFNLHQVYAPTMLLIAIGGLVVNLIGAYILHKGSEENLNVKGAFLHVCADLLGSVGAIIAGALIYFFGWHVADPIVSFVIGFLVLISSFGIIKSAFNILMEGVPSHINVEEVQKELENIENVKNVHDLHIWCLNTNTVALSVHCVTDMSNNEQILCKVNHILKEHFGIGHSTIQLEPENFDSKTCAFDNHKHEYNN